MQINQYTYNSYEDSLTVFDRFGNSLIIYLRDWSGKLIFRYKIGFPQDAKHTGIAVGQDCYGNWIVLHNHTDYGCAVIDTYEGFAKNCNVNWLDKECVHNDREVLENGLNEAILGKPYHLLDYNCQSYTNTACEDNTYSESVEEWKKPVMGILAIAGIALLGAALFGGGKK
jgi:hypothetical protein